MKVLRQQVGWSAACVIAGLAVIYAFSPAEHAFYPRCPIYAFTHLLCPGCGATRALYELLHLNLRGALHFNALATIFVPCVLLWFGWGCYQAFRSNRFPAVPWPRTVALCLGVASILFTVARNTGMAFAI
jgi:hypothetical protein